MPSSAKQLYVIVAGAAFLALLSFVFASHIFAAWVDAPAGPPNYGATGCSPAPCLEADFKPVNLTTIPQYKQGPFGATQLCLGTDPSTNCITAWPSGGGGTITGAGTSSYLARWTGVSSLGNSLVFDNGTSVGIGNSVPSARLTVNNPLTAGKNGSSGDALYAYASSANAAISAEQSGSGYAIYASGGTNYFSDIVGIGISSGFNPIAGNKLEVAGSILGTGFFDQNNTAYFLDPASSIAGNLNGTLTALGLSAGALKVTGGSGVAGQVLTSSDIFGTATWQALPASASMGSGTANRVAKWTGTGATIGDSVIQEDASGYLGIGAAPQPSYKLKVGGGALIDPGYGVPSATWMKLKVGGDELSLQDAATNNVLPFISWHESDGGPRAMYMGYGSTVPGGKRLDMALENGYDLSIWGGNVGIGGTPLAGYSLAVVGNTATVGNITVSGTGSAAGIYSDGSANTGVEGVTSGSSQYGVYGLNTSNGYGVYGYSASGGTGVVGRSSTGTGVFGGTSSSGGTGVFGSSGSGTGTYGQSNTGYGVYGYSNSSFGVYGYSVSNYAGYFNGDVAVIGNHIATGPSISASGAFANGRVYCASGLSFATYITCSDPRVTFYTTPATRNDWPVSSISSGSLGYAVCFALGAGNMSTVILVDGSSGGQSRATLDSLGGSWELTSDTGNPDKISVVNCNYN